MQLANPSIVEPVRVLLVGRMPPPFGGVSVHLWRLANRLRDENWDVSILNLNRGDFALTVASGVKVIQPKGSELRRAFHVTRLARNLPERTVVHFHVSRFASIRGLIAFVWLARLFRGRPCVLTFHGGRLTQLLQKPIRRVLLRRALTGIEQVVVVSDEQMQSLVACGIEPKRISHIPAFVYQPVDPDQECDEIKSIPTGTTIVLTSGYLIPIYDYDVVIDCIDAFDQNRFHFVFAFYSDCDPVYERHVLHRVQQKANVTLLRNQDPNTFLATLDRATIYVRPTRQDGDAVAIREALAMNKIVIASDCVSRPAGCRVFTQGSARELKSLIQEAATVGKVSAEPKSPNSDCVARITELYHIACNHVETATRSTI